MTLVDTSAWIDHLYDSSPALVRLLSSRTVYTHPFVVGELACGTLRNREAVLKSLLRLPRVVEVEHHYVLTLIDQHRLMGAGIGWIDAHLLASCIVMECTLLTLDRALRAAATKLSVHLEG